MLLIARRTAVGAALLLIMPAVVWISGWKWHPELSAGMMKLLYWVTETVTQPWGIITHVILCAWFLWCLRFRSGASPLCHLAGTGPAGAGHPILHLETQRTR